MIRNGHRARLAAYAVVVVVGAAGFWRMESTVNRLDNVVHDNEAQRCADAWQHYQDELESAPIVAESLIEYATGEVDPGNIERFQAIFDRRLKERVTPPDCDLEAARRRLN